MSRPTLLMTALVTTLAAAAVGGSSRSAVDIALEGADPEPAGRVVPTIEAAFELEGYRPGQRATLTIENPTRDLRLQIFRAGPEHVATTTDTEMNGSP
jgi:hypothetical protein